MLHSSKLYHQTQAFNAKWIRHRNSSSRIVLNIAPRKKYRHTRLESKKTNNLEDREREHTVSLERVSTPFRLVSPLPATDNHFKLVHMDILCTAPSDVHIRLDFGKTAISYSCFNDTMSAMELWKKQKRQTSLTSRLVMLFPEISNRDNFSQASIPDI